MTRLAVESGGGIPGDLPATVSRAHERRGSGLLLSLAIVRRQECTLCHSAAVPYGAAAHFARNQGFISSLPSAYSRSTVCNLCGLQDRLPASMVAALLHSDAVYHVDPPPKQLGQFSLHSNYSQQAWRSSGSETDQNVDIVAWPELVSKRGTGYRKLRRTSTHAIRINDMHGCADPRR